MLWFPQKLRKISEKILLHTICVSYLLFYFNLWLDFILKLISLTSYFRHKYYYKQQAMIDQFRNLISTPKASPTDLLLHTQDLILSTLQEFLPPSFDTSQLDKIFDNLKHPEENDPDYFEEKHAENLSRQQLTNTTSGNHKNILKRLEEHIEVNYQLVAYFVRTMKQNCVSLQAYQLLQDQTQKAEATIRSHIQLQQEMHMHMQQLEKKQIYYQELAEKSINEVQTMIKRPEIEQRMEKSNQRAMMHKNQELESEKIKLIAMNNRLKQQVRELREQLQKLLALNKYKKNVQICRKLVNLPYRKQPQPQKQPFSLNSFTITSQINNGRIK